MALLPLGYLKAVVSLGVLQASGEFSHTGTGFLCRHPVLQIDDKTRYGTFLVTNRHVVQDVTHVRFNRLVDDAVDILPVTELMPERAGLAWAFHETADVAARPVAGGGTGPLTEGRDPTEAEVFMTDIGAPNAEEKRCIVEGNGVFVLGFPMGLVGETRNYPIVRHGVVARIQDYLCGEAPTFLIDSLAFPGNSGGPVVVEPQQTAVRGTTATSHALLIGVVSRYIPYTDVAVSAQTKRARITFEENSGLAEVVPIDTVKEVLTESISSASASDGYRWVPRQPGR